MSLGALAALVLVPACATRSGSPSTAPTPAPAGRLCRPDQIDIHLATGLPSMHTLTTLIEVRNVGRQACKLQGLPSVGLLDSNGRVAQRVAASSHQPSAGVSSQAARALRPGETATSQLVETSPIAPMTCPSYPRLSVSLWTSDPARVFTHRISGCPSGVELTSFVPGFNGTAPSGKIVGTAPACPQPSQSSTTLGPAVSVEARSGGAVRGATTVFAKANHRAPFQIVLSPGHYHVTSAHTRSRRVTVALGRVVDLGRFGGCSTLATVTTIPARGKPTTPTTVPGGDATTTTRSSARTPLDRLTRIAFSSPSQGYGLFVRQGTSTCQALIGSTADGGAVFGSLTSVASWRCATAAPVTRLAFDDRGDGFAYDPALFVTHDSGATWTQLSRSGVVLSVAARGRSVWVVETTCATPSTFQNPCPLRLVESTNGGRTWHRVQTPKAAVAAGGGAGQTYLIRLGPRRAYLVSNPPFGRQGSSAIAPLWFTRDGGRTWSARQVDCGISSFFDALSAAPDGTLVAVCAGQPSAGSQPKVTVRSTNGGRTWTTMTPCPNSHVLRFACTTAMPLGFGYLGAIDAVSAHTVYLVGGRSSLLVTHDGGAHWHVVKPMIGDTAGGSWDVNFFNRRHGFVLGSDPNNAETITIWSTSTAGAAWHSVVPTESIATEPSVGFKASSVSFTSAQTGWVLGVAPCGKRMCTRLLRTSDGGATWHRIPAPPAPVDPFTRTGISELHFADDRDGYAFGGSLLLGSPLWVTHDGGQQWKDLTSLAGLRPDVVGSVVSTTTDVFALVAGYAGPPGLGAGGAKAPWRIIEAATASNRFHTVATMGGTTGAPLSGALAAAGGIVYAIDGASLLRLDGTSTRSSPLPSGHNCEGPIAASSADDVLLVCGQGVADGSMGQRELFGTTDGGRSWVQLADPGVGGGYDTMGVADAGSGHAAISTVSGGEAGLLITTNFGNSWSQTIDFRDNNGEPFTDLSYQSSSQVVAVYGPVQARAMDGQPFIGVGDVFKSTDGGLTWTRIAL